MVGEEGRGDGGEERGADGGKVVTCARQQGAERGVVWGRRGWGGWCRVREDRSSLRRDSGGLLSSLHKKNINFEDENISSGMNAIIVQNKQLILLCVHKQTLC